MRVEVVVSEPVRLAEIVSETARAVLNVRELFVLIVEKRDRHRE